MVIRSTIYLWPDLKKQSAIFAKKNNSSIAEIIRKYLYDVVEREGIKLDAPRMKPPQKRKTLFMIPKPQPTTKQLNNIQLAALLE